MYIADLRPTFPAVPNLFAYTTSYVPFIAITLIVQYSPACQIVPHIVSVNSTAFCNNSFLKYIQYDHEGVGFQS